jgi:hypothetical protein
MPIEPFWTATDGLSAWYRVHILEKNYSVKIVQDPFEEDGLIAEVRAEWSGNKSMARTLSNGEEYDRVCAAYHAAKNTVKIVK